MRICVIVPSRVHFDQAGIRIRYERIRDELEKLGHFLELVSLEDITSSDQFTHDIYIFSKCYDARGLVTGELLARKQIPVGVDLFDDYFSQLRDSRLARFRQWLRSMSGPVDFTICSTPMMQEVIKGYFPGKTNHILSDVSLPISEEFIYNELRRKLEIAMTTGILNVCWFGIGDNPFFPVGLSDLVAFGDNLDRLSGRGFQVDLRVLTNLRALSADGLAMLNRLSVPYTVEEWSEERERSILGTSMISFLPVNAQNFSIVKSLNRAITAFASGCQVLSSGYPLYESLSPFIYYSPDKLLDDIENRQPALREETVPVLASILAQCADPEKEARSLAGFLESCRRDKSVVPTVKTSVPLALIHGKITTREIHEFAQNMGILSVASPFCATNMDFDMRISFTEDGKGFNAFINDSYREVLDPVIARQLTATKYGKSLKTGYKILSLSRLYPDLMTREISFSITSSAMSEGIIYTPIMAMIVNVMRRLFPGITCHFSEYSYLPWLDNTRNKALDSEVT